MVIPTLPLNDGHRIPQIGFGTWPLTDDELPELVRTAIDAGHRHIDTAAAYGNETGVGAGIRSSDIDRAEIFVTTKIGNDSHGFDDARRAADDSLRRLGTDYVDLLLIHWPMPQQNRYVQTWRALIALKEDGKARSIGVSNFKPPQLERLMAETGVAPAVNQIELNPVVRHDALRRFNAEQGILTESWSPLGPTTGLLTDERLASIATKHGKSVGQVILRWHLDLGLVAIPKSATPARIAQNIDVFNFTLDDDDRETIDSFDQGFDAVYPEHLA